MTEEEINEFYEKHDYELFPEIIEWYCIGYDPLFEKWESKIIKSNSYKCTMKLFKHTGLVNLFVCPNTKVCRDALLRCIFD